MLPKLRGTLLTERESDKGHVPASERIVHGLRRRPSWTFGVDDPEPVHRRDDADNVVAAAWVAAVDVDYDGAAAADAATPDAVSGPPVEALAVLGLVVTAVADNAEDFEVAEAEFAAIVETSAVGLGTIVVVAVDSAAGQLGWRSAI